VATGCAATIDPGGFAKIADRVVPNAIKLDPSAWDAKSAAPVLGSPHTRAFVPVQNGCDHACTFCIIPLGRGPSRSRPVAEVVAEIAALAERGVGEVVLTGVDLTSYDAPNLGALVAAILAGVPALPRLRLSSLDGVEIDPLLFELLTQEPRVMPHVHLSLQSGDDMVLKRMKRRHSRGEAITLVHRLKAARPGIAIGADLIAGFPTESEAMHRASLAIITECDIVHGHVFPYSPRPGTPAARMPQVAPSLVRERAADLRAAVAERRAWWLAGLLGSRQAVLAERDGTGHAPNFAQVRLPAGTAPGRILELTPNRIQDGLLV
jgi:threonylcarbamoyladenosine tRNA methylthiotransferase MtaB